MRSTGTRSWPPPTRCARANSRRFLPNRTHAIFAARGGYGQDEYCRCSIRRDRAHPESVRVFDATFLLNAGGAGRDGMLRTDGRDGLRADWARPRSIISADSGGRGGSFGYRRVAQRWRRRGRGRGRISFDGGGGDPHVRAALDGDSFGDTGEKAYRIDRMLVQLGQAGVLGRVAAVVFGCAARRQRGGASTNQRMRRRTGSAPRSGARGNQERAMKRELYNSLWVRARVDAGARRLLLRPAVVV